MGEGIFLPAILDNPSETLEVERVREDCDDEREDSGELGDLIFGERCNDDSDSFEDPLNNKFAIAVVDCDSNIDMEDELNVEQVCTMTTSKIKVLNLKLDNLLEVMRSYNHI